MIRRPPRSTLFPTRRSSDLTPKHTDVLLHSTKMSLLSKPTVAYKAQLKRTLTTKAETQAQKEFCSSKTRKPSTYHDVPNGDDELGLRSNRWCC